MRPVARIAQSVEQGIENPRVLGSIPSPGTTLLLTDVNRRLFSFVVPAKIDTLPKFQLHRILFDSIPPIVQVQSRVHISSIESCTHFTSQEACYGSD